MDVDGIEFTQPSKWDDNGNVVIPYGQFKIRGRYVDGNDILKSIKKCKVK